MEPLAPTAAGDHQVGADGPLVQLTLWEPQEPVINLRDKDRLIWLSSGGKDSVAVGAKLRDQALAEGVLDRLICVHADLGFIEWQGTRELVEQQARELGINRFEAVSRQRDGAAEDLLAYALRRGMWPSPTARWCTSDLKTGPTSTLIRRLSNEVAQADPGRITPVQVLVCLGMRAQESRRRKKMNPVTADPNLSTRQRVVTRWLPVHSWTTEQVFAAGDAAGVTRHPAYALGQSRASCVLCIFLPRHELATAARHNAFLAQCYELVERSIGHRFRLDVSIADVLAEVGIPPLPADTPLDTTLWADLAARSTRRGDLPPPLPTWTEVVAWHSQHR